MPSTRRPAADRAFVPKLFFLGESSGVGIDRDPFGRIFRRCALRTHGTAHPTVDAVCVDETLSYDDGEVQRWRWVLGDGGDGRYLVAESQAGSGHMARRLADGDLVFSFRRDRGVLSTRHRTRFTLLGQDIALETTWVSFLGAPLLTFTAVRHRGQPCAGGGCAGTELDEGRVGTHAAADVSLAVRAASRA